MKVAILICGQLRTWKTCAPVLKQYLLSKHDCDVFLSIDLINSLQSDYKNNPNESSFQEMLSVIEFFKPKSVWYANNPHDWSTWDTCFPPDTTVKVYGPGHINLHLCAESHEYKLSGPSCDRTSSEPAYAQIPNRQRIYEPVFRQYTFVSKAIEMMRDFAEETKTRYTKVVRTRFDQLFWTEPLLKHVYPLFERDENGKITNSIKNQNVKLPNSAHLLIDLDDIGDGKIAPIFVFAAGSNFGMMYVNDQFWISSYSMAVNVLKEFHGKEVLRLFLLFEKEGWFRFEAWTEIIWAHFLLERGVRIFKSQSIPDGDFVRAI